MENPRLKQKIKELPKKPGVYLFKNSKDKVIYVGKAKILRGRVSSYFQKTIKLGTKTQALVSRINDIEIVITESELEALILEAELIKKHRPKYNITLKDDKSHLYIVIRNDSSGFPRILTARKTDLQKKDISFGPYTDSGTARYVIKVIRKVLPYKDCSFSKFNLYQKINRPCLYGQINLCQVPCIGNVSKEKYKKDIEKIKKLLSGKGSLLIKEVQKSMNEASESLEYEKAAQFRDILKKFEYVRSTFRSADKYIENPNLMEDLASEAMDELVASIPILTEIPRRIECYDISTISGKEAVGSMVVAKDGVIDKSEYKRFKIRFKDTPDDFGMMKEVLQRRLKRNDWEKPDLIVLDGGKGQVSTVLNLKPDIVVIGLAKRFERIVFKKGEKFEELKLPKGNKGLNLLIKLRDEAHRFAQRYHHLLRLRKIRVK
ncbi:GIY-YIG nuclease family protein [Patescibacteria group bacterium]